MQKGKSTSGRARCQRFIDMNPSELEAELSEKYLEIVIAKGFLFFETKLSFEISYHGSISKLDQINMVCKMLEYTQMEEKLNKLIRAYKLETSFKLYVDDYDQWLKLHFNENPIPICKPTNQGIGKNHLRVVA